jgi:transcription initiation factor TFIID subunit 6
VEKIAAQNIRQLLVKSVSPVLKSLREPPDNPEEFRAAYGSLGPHLLSGVERARKQSGSSKQQQQQGGAAGGPGLLGRQGSTGGLPGGPPGPRPPSAQLASPSAAVHTQKVGGVDRTTDYTQSGNGRFLAYISS